MYLEYHNTSQFFFSNLEKAYHIIIRAELTRARERSPWKPIRIRENLVMTLTYAGKTVRIPTTCKPMSNVTLDLAQINFDTS